MANRIVRGGLSWRAVLVLLVMALSLSLAPTAAFADTVNWSIMPTGTIAYAGFGTLGNPLVGGVLGGVGQSIGVASVQNVTTGAMINISSGKLNFTTGTDLGGWNWGTGGSLTLTGCFGAVTNCSTILFSDGFTNAFIMQPYGNPNYQVHIGNITGALYLPLANALGVLPGVATALYDTTIDVGNPPNCQVLLNCLLPGAAFTGVNLGGTITSTALAASIPLPESSSLSFLGFGLVAMAGAGAMRRKLFA